MGFIKWMVLKNRLKAIPMFIKDKNVSILKKCLILLGIVYLLMPLDIIPAVVPVFGFLDDLILWVFILTHLKDDLDKYTMPQEGENGAVKYSDKKVLDVNYTVEDEKEKSNHEQ